MARKKTSATATKNMGTTNMSDMWTYRDSAQRGTAGITGFDVEAVDGSIGSIDEASDDAAASYVVVDTGPWIFGKKVLIPAGAIDRIDSQDRRVWLNRTKNQIEDAPEFDELRYREDDYRTEVGAYYAGSAARYSDAGRTDLETDRNVLERNEERLTVDKHAEQAGSVRVGKHVVEEQQSVDVPVTREEVTLERRSVDRPATGESLEETSIDVPVYEDRLEVNKHARVVEELELGKTEHTDTERVTETVRREEFDVDADEGTIRR